MVNNHIFGQNKGFRLTYNAKRLGDSCFQLTVKNYNQNGAIWSQNRIDLNQNFRIYAKLNFGDDWTGADGIGFVIQYLGSNLGSTGEGIGFGGISPSLGIEFDTYQNPYDPGYDHIALIKNGNGQHTVSPSTTLKGPNISLNPGGSTVKDGKYYPVEINWNANLKTLICKFNGVQKINHIIDLQKDIFKDSQFVYWGFTAATGGSTNTHSVCIDSFFVTYENSCKIKYTNQTKPYYLCSPKKDTLTINYNEIPKLYSKITWSTGDTTKSIFTLIDHKNNRFWATVSNKFGTCKDTVNFTFIEPKLNIDTQYNFECTTANKKFTIPGNWVSALWNDNSKSFSKTLNNPGKYWVEVLDKYKCSTRDTFEYVIRPDTLKIKSIKIENPSCLGSVDGSAEISLVNRPLTEPLNYIWKPSNPNIKKITNLKSGNYQCVVIDIKGCRDSVDLILIDPKTLKINLISKKDISCFGFKDGELLVSATNGKSPYFYSLNLLNQQASGTFNSLAPATYRVKVTDSSKCIDSLDAIINEPDSLNLSISAFQGDCFGDSKGKIESLASGGTLPYSWNPTPNNIYSVTLNGKSAEKSNLLNLPSKNYTIFIQDFNGCKKSISKFISPKENISITIDTSMKFNAAEKTMLNVNISPKGNYQYLWSPENIFGTQKNDSHPIIKLYNRTFIQVKVTNENFCSKSANFEIPVVIPPIYFWFPTAFSPDENGLNDGYGPVGNFDWADFKIYSRWGEQLFQSTKEIQKWDGNYNGKPCPEGVYIILARLHYDRFEQKRDGRSSFTLIR